MNAILSLLLVSLVSSAIVDGNSSPLIITNLHTINQHRVHLNGLGPWTDHLTMSSPEGSETCGSTLRMELDPQTGLTTIGHSGQAFIGIFRPCDLTADILYPPQTTFSSNESSLPQSDESDAIAMVDENDVLVALIPMTVGWQGLRPVDLQGAIGGVDPSDTPSFNDFVKNLPKIVKDYDVSIVVASFHRRPKALTTEYHILHTRDSRSNHLLVGDDRGDTYFYRPPVITQSRPITMPIPRQEEPVDAEERDNMDNMYHSLSSSSSSLSDSSKLSSSSSSGKESGDYGYNDNRSSSSSSSSDTGYDFGLEQRSPPRQTQRGRGRRGRARRGESGLGRSFHFTPPHG